VASEIELNKFLNFYKEYSIESFENWEKLDLLVKNEIDKDIERQQEKDRINKNTIINIEKPWWKFW
jgi:hypothetical protein